MGKFVGNSCFGKDRHRKVVNADTHAAARNYVSHSNFVSLKQLD